MKPAKAEARRYALYFVPARDSALNAAGSAWLGRDVHDGRAFAQPEIDGIAPWRLAELTLNARRYGFHATLKAPAPLADGADEADYVAAVAEFCRQTPAVTLPATRLGDFGGIHAIVAARAHAPLDALERRIVEHFEPWRGGLGAEAMERRRRGNLSPRQLDMLERWGYAYAVEEFTFHMTLTDRLPDGEADAVIAAIRTHFADFLGAPLDVDRLGICVEDEPGAPFRILDSFALEGGK